MAMTTRFASKKREENIQPLVGKLKMVDTKLSQKTGLVDEKRKAFGEIHNRREIGSILDNNKNGIEKKTSLANSLSVNSVVYKDIKPRVDTRWKKKETTVEQKPSDTASVATQTKPLSRQNSKASDLTKKTTNVKSITDKISAQIKKTTSIASSIDYKRTQNVQEKRIENVPLIRSPAKSLIKNFHKQDSGLHFFETHSTFMLNQVDNIDETDKENPQLLSEYVNDIYAYLMKLEKQFPIRENFLDNQMDVTPKMRSVLLDWISEVHHQFGLEIETFHMAVSIVDRYLQAQQATPRRYLQLVGVTALFMASKYEELMPPEISDFVYVTDDTYEKKQILQMEMQMFKTLEYSLCKPLPIHFLRRFAKAAGSLGDRQYIAAKYFIELAAIDYELTKYNPSEIAAAAIYLSLFITNKMKSDNDLWTPTLQFYSTYKIENIMPVVKRLALLVSTAHEVKLKSVYTKYAHAHFKFTSTMSEMTGSKIRELARYA
ncbi:hypothetical protein PVAND_003840 [Polypedilum vanderplanki]|uniref:G2/mitotic-specific cyclin-B n=1 Tax=Polypedilum vanderplanki TaxID=319348 RepID=A0A9J6BVS4_POLVA|nr:hypothetical protein PVAND_003840 [Polypedilum vanderplanki]